MQRSELKTGVLYGRFPGNRTWTLSPAIVVDTSTLWVYRECLVTSTDGSRKSEHRYIPSDAKHYQRGRGWAENEHGLLVLTVANCLPKNTVEQKQNALAELEKVAASLPAEPTVKDVQRLWKSINGSSVYLTLENPANIKGEYAPLAEAEEMRAREAEAKTARKKAERKEFAVRAETAQSTLNEKGVRSARVSRDYRKVTIDLEELESLLRLIESK